MSIPRVLWTGALALIWCGGTFGQQIDPSALAKAGAELRDAVDSGEIEGGIHLVSREGKVIHLEVAGYADIAEKTPLRADAIVRIYSMSKPITSVAAMVLFEQGKFQLDDAVAKYIPAFRNAVVIGKPGGSTETVPPVRPITVRDLLRHTSGYSYGAADPRIKPFYERESLLYGPPVGMMPPKLTIAQAAEALARIPAAHQPGERFTYGLNSDLLGRLIEVWSGKRLDEQLRVSVLEPLEMVDTGFSVPNAKRGRFASCHAVIDGKPTVVDKGSTSPFLDGFAFLSGGGGLVSTAQDYANFCQMLVDRGEFKGKRLLKEETVKLMFTDQLEKAGGDGVGGVGQGVGFGLGFAIRPVTLGQGASRRQAQQYSWGGYASTDFRLVPEDRLFQIVIRQRVPSSHTFADKLISTVYEGVK